jgi:poly-gamma-glutamate synthesis protein (capsule biosynthesis protein)
MLYQSEGGEFNIALAGDAMVAQRLSVFDEPKYKGLIKLFNDADAAFCNLEMPIHNYEYPHGFMHGTFMASHPLAIKELKWMGINMMSTANSHTFDYGVEGMLSTVRKLEEAEMVHAGAGRTLSEARAPGYLDTRNGRVALLSVASSSSSAEWGKAGEQGPDIQGRPGVSFLRYQTIHTVDSQSFEELKRISEKLGLEHTKAERSIFGFLGESYETAEREFYFTTFFSFNQLEDFEGVKFVEGDRFGTTTKVHTPDLQDILRWVRDARRQADWVVISLHAHEGGVATVDGNLRWRRDIPADFLKDFAHACIDAGVDVVVGHGPHILRGIEIYKGKPIFYSLGELVLQNETVRWLPIEAYRRKGLGPESTPADFFDARSAKDTKGMPINPRMWRSVVPLCRFGGGALKKIELYPIDLGYGRRRSQRGRPLLADEPVAEAVINDLKELSKPFGTQITKENERWVISP